MTLIYELSAEGASLRAIASRLMEMNIKAPRGGKVWGIETIRKILNNEKYYGDVLLQKTYIADFLQESKLPTAGSVRAMLRKTIMRRLYREKVFKKRLDLRVLRSKTIEF